MWSTSLRAVSCTLKPSRAILPGNEWTNQSKANSFVPNSIPLHEFGSKQYIYLLIGWPRCLQTVCIVYGRNWFDWIIAGFAQREFSLDHERQHWQPLPSLEQQNRVKVCCGLWFIAPATNRRCHFAILIHSSRFRWWEWLYQKKKIINVRGF